MLDVLHLPSETLHIHHLLSHLGLPQLPSPLDFLVSSTSGKDTQRSGGSRRVSLRCNVVAKSRFIAVSTGDSLFYIIIYLLLQLFL